MNTLPTLVIPGSSLLQYETNFQTKSRLFHDKSFPSLPEENPSDLTKANYRPPIRANQITLMEFYQAIIRPAPLKALGHTLISTIILQNPASFLSLRLQRVINESLELGYCTKLFRGLVTISMQKPHKDNYEMVKSYQPIVLLDTIEKTFGSIIAK